MPLNLWYSLYILTLKTFYEKKRHVICFWVFEIFLVHLTYMYLFEEISVLVSNLCYCLQQNYSLAELDEKISALKQALLRKSRETESMQLTTFHEN